MGFDDDHIGDSRTLEFEDKFRAVTGGRGVDVVLDSLAGDFVDASLRLVAPRRGVPGDGQDRHPRPGEIAEQYSGVRYRAFDLFEAGPDHIERMLTDLSAMFDDTTLRPLPVTAFDVRRAPAALRYLSQARHIGKVVLTHAGCLGAGHRGDHRWHRHGGFGVGPPRRRQSRGSQPGADRSARSGCAGRCGVGGGVVRRRCRGVGGRLRCGGSCGAGQGAGRHPGAASVVGGDSHRRCSRRRGGDVVDAGAGRRGVAGQGGYRLESA